MKPTLQIEQDLPFQYRQWRVERAGWAIIGLIILAAFAGVFGHHPFARATAQTPDGALVVEYDRFARYESDTEMNVSVTLNADSGTRFRFWMDDDYLEKLKAAEPTCFTPKGANSP